MMATLLLSGCGDGSHWSTASRDSAGVAPLPTEELQAVVQVYAANVWGWRGWFADHTWIATKRANADHYVVYQVLGWRVSWGDPALHISQDIPDRHWYGAKPRLLVNWRGDDAKAMIKKIDTVARQYPYPNEYKMFPGPNSNTFTAWMAQEVPELGLSLSLRAIGKGYPL